MGRMKLLAITSRFPYPLEKGDKLRAYHQLRALSERHQVILVALSDAPVEPEHLARLEEFCATVHVVALTRSARAIGLLRAGLGGEPLQVGWFRSAHAEREVRRIVADERPDHVYCQLIRSAPYGRGLPVRSTIDYQDAFSAAAVRRAESAPVWLRPILRSEARRVARYERRARGWFDHQVIISDQDRELLEVGGVDGIEVVPNGVDTQFFAPVAPAADQCDISFVGNMGYAPNVAAAATLVEEVLPLVRERRPGASVVLAGARPARSVLRLVAPGVEVSGWLDDIRDGYARGRIMVAPLTIGAGQQNKILEAMSMGVPCVTTELVNRAIGATPGREVLVGDSPRELADHATRLLDDEDLRRQLAESGRRLVQERYSWSAVGDRLGELFAS